VAELVKAKQEFIGLSSEDFPDGAPDGSTFHIVDTGDVYVIYKGDWAQDLRLIKALQNSL